MKSKFLLFIIFFEFAITCVSVVNGWAFPAAVGSGFAVACLAMFLSVNEEEAKQK